MDTFFECIFNPSGGVQWKRLNGSAHAYVILCRNIQGPVFLWIPFVSMKKAGLKDICASKHDFLKWVIHIKQRCAFFLTSTFSFPFGTSLFIISPLLRKCPQNPYHISFDSPELKKGRRLLDTSQLVKDLQHRLSSLLKDKEFAKARQDRAAQKSGIIEDALIAHNLAVSEELLYLDPSSIIGEVKENDINQFRNRMNVYIKKNGTGNQGYDTSPFKVTKEY